MDTSLFQKWFDDVFAPSVRQWTTRNVALLLDNCPSHHIQNKFPFIKIFFLPPNVTSMYQPNDMGIIVSFKRKYKGRLVVKLLDAVENWDQLVQLQPLQPHGCKGLEHGYKPNLMDCAKISADCWDEVSSETIMNCWIKSNILPKCHSDSLKLMSEKWKKRSFEPAEEQAQSDDEEEDVDNLTVGMIRRRLMEAKLNSDQLQNSFARDNSSQLPKLFVDNLLMEEDCAEEELLESFQRW
jgi:hypothetical protein